MDEDEVKRLRRTVRSPLAAVSGIEFPIYAMLKLHHCEQASGGLSGPRLVTSRWLRGLLERAQHASVEPAELHGVNSHFLRERLRNLNHGTALKLQGRGLRASVGYAWNEDINAAMLHSFGQLRALLGGETSLCIDTVRLLDRFAGDVFDARAFTGHFLRLRGAMLGRRLYTLASGEAKSDAEFAKYLQGRLQRLVAAGIIAPQEPGFRLTPKGERVGQWFYLLINSVDFPTEKTARVAKAA